MNTLIDNSTEWITEVGQNIKNKNYKFLTKDTYLDKDILFKVEISDVNLIPENIKNGVTILETTGTYSGDARL